MYAIYKCSPALGLTRIHVNWKINWREYSVTFEIPPPFLALLVPRNLTQPFFFRHPSICPTWNAWRPITNFTITSRLRFSIVYTVAFYPSMLQSLYTGITAIRTLIVRLVSPVQNMTFVFVLVFFFSLSSAWYLFTFYVLASKLSRIISFNPLTVE